LRARKSLSALRAYLAAEAVAEEAVPEASPDDLPSNSPILTPRIDWESQGFNYAGWNMAKPTQHKSRDSTDTMAEFGDPFLDVTSEIDYTKSFFYKPDTPTRGPSRLEPRKQRSIKSLKAALRLPVAPPVPVIPDKFKSPTTPTRTPPLPVARLPVATPSLFIHSPGAFEQGRPARPIILGADLEGRDIVNNWGKGVRKGKGKRVVKRSYDWD
jgi:hypothetical protein